MQIIKDAHEELVDDPWGIDQPPANELAARRIDAVIVQVAHDLIYPEDDPWG